MKIDDQQAQQAAQVTGSSAIRRVGPGFSLNGAYGLSGATGPDRATLSNFGQEIQRFTELVKKLPDIREDKVQSIETRLQAGEYHVPVADVAEAIFRLRTELDRD